ncbi:MAG TPA: ATP-dependent zinc metalloprotease FtsH [Bdellovibrionota bacterium]|nr:ATP-dependent zinc metalloprotease FtsH [Bdellovibrionota bacterium]
MKSSLRAIFLWVAVIALVVWVAGTADVAPNKSKQINYAEVIRTAREGKVESLTQRGDSKILGKYKPDYKDGATFESPGKFQDTHIAELDKLGLIINQEEEPRPGFLQTALLSWLPILAILFIFFLFMRQLQSGSNKAMSFGQSRARQFNENQSKIKFTDVAGCDEAKEELVETVDFLKNPKKFTRLGGKMPRGVLLVGPPGTGKTLLAKAVAGEAGVPFFSISGSDFVEMFVGVGASRVRSLFENAKKAAPCVIFIDEIDAVGRHRGAGLGGGHDEREQTLNQLLVEMDGFEGSEGVIVMAATNRVDVLDPALLRPGRFDRRVHVPKPDLKGRLEILKVHTAKTPLGGTVDLDIVARSTPGFSGADLANLVNEAAILAARRNVDFVEGADFEEAKDKVIMGSARKSMIISDVEKKHTAYHEAGHAIVAFAIDGNDPVHKVTIIPRGPALGVTMTLPVEDRFTLTKERAQAMIAYMMGGRVAEELIFKHLTTGASNDIERATELARRMVTEWGMSEKLGPLNYAKSQENIFLGREISQHSVFSAETSKLIDDEIRKIVEDAYDKAMKAMTKHKKELEVMAEALLKYETIDAEDVIAIMDGRPVVKDIGVREKSIEKEASPKETTDGDQVSVVDLAKPVKV